MFAPIIIVWLDFQEGNVLDSGLTVEDMTEIDVVFEDSGDFHPTVFVFDYRTFL